MFTTNMLKGSDCNNNVYIKTNKSTFSEKHQKRRLVVYAEGKFFLRGCLKQETEGEFMADEETVKLISADGHQFVVDRKAALVSGTIKSMLSGPGMSPWDFKKPLYPPRIYPFTCCAQVHSRSRHWEK